MTTADLRQLFLEEHKRDKKLMLINFFVISFFVLLLIGLIAFLIISAGGNIFAAITSLLNGGDESGNAPFWQKLIFPAICIVYILYPFFLMWKVSKRPKEIEELLQKIEAGSKATTVQDDVEYKITVPLLKINLKLCPVTFATIYLNNDVKPYRLPIRKIHFPDMKIVLSGANINKVNEIRDILYSENAPEQPERATLDANSIKGNDTPTPIKSVDEFRAFLKENLQDTLDNIDGQRKKTRTMAMILIPLVIIVIFGFAGYYIYNSFQSTAAGNYGSNVGDLKMILPFFAVIIIASFAYSYYMRSKVKKQAANETHTGDYTSMMDGTSSFNDVVFKKIIKFINPTVEYIPLGHIGLPEFLESGMFQEKSYNISGGHEILGHHNSVPFIMCELFVDYKRNFSDEKKAPDNVFSGQFFVARFNKKFSSTVFIKPKKGFFASDTTGAYTHSVGEKVLLEDPEFMEMFNVEATDQVEARYILTPTLMENIKDLAKRSKTQFYIAFNDNKITVANNTNSSQFSVGYFSSITKNDNALLVDFYKNICNQFAIIDDLRLNVKIWG